MFLIFIWNSVTTFFGNRVGYSAVMLFWHRVVEMFETNTPQTARKDNTNSKPVWLNYSSHSTTLTRYTLYSILYLSLQYHNDPFTPPIFLCCCIRSLTVFSVSPNHLPVLFLSRLSHHNMVLYWQIRSAKDIIWVSLKKKLSMLYSALALFLTLMSHDRSLNYLLRCK